MIMGHEQKQKTCAEWHNIDLQISNKMACACSPRQERKGRRKGSVVNLIVKEGFLCKKGGVIKSWSRRYFILNRQCLCYFKRELSVTEDADLQPMGRVFLSDVVNIETDGVEKKKSFVFALHTKKRAVLLQASNDEDKEKWIGAIRQALETDSKAEREDPFRRTLRRLRPGLKRVTLVKDPVKGIGCTIKSAAGHILVNRILEDGPIAHTGILRPGDEILDIHGTAVTGLKVAEVVAVIRTVPDQFLATVRPITSITKDRPVDTRNVVYSEIKPQSATVAVARPTVVPEIFISNEEGPPVPSLDSSPTPSLEDVGFYDDEDEGDTPPPLPPRTEDALILIDPPPQNGVFKPPLPPKPIRDAEDLSLHHRGNGRERGRNVRGERPPMQKSKSEEYVVLQDAPSGGGRSPCRTRPHIYDEIQPSLNYMDIGKLEFAVEKSGPKRESIVKVEMDWKKKVQV